MSIIKIESTKIGNMDAYIHAFGHKDGSLSFSNTIHVKDKRDYSIKCTDLWSCDTLTEAVKQHKKDVTFIKSVHKYSQSR